MFQGGPRPRRPLPPRYHHHRPISRRQKPKNSNVLSQIYDSIEKLDKEKMAKTAESIKELYNQVSPMLSKLIKK
jgi:hypothetical protein